MALHVSGLAKSCLLLACLHGVFSDDNVDNLDESLELDFAHPLPPHPAEGQLWRTNDDAGALRDGDNREVYRDDDNREMFRDDDYEGVESKDDGTEVVKQEGKRGGVGDLEEARTRDDDAGDDRDDAGVDRDDAGVDRDDAGVDRDDAGVGRDDAGVDRDDAGVDRDDKEQARAKVYGHIVQLKSDVNRTKLYDGDFHHPFHIPDIVDDVYHTYRRFRKMKLVREGRYWMGTNDPRSQTGEFPVREVHVRSFYMDAFPVISAFYWAFRAKKKFVRSDAEVKGWSWVQESFVTNRTRAAHSTHGPAGWLAVKKARWDRPEGPDSDLQDRWTHPVVHVSWFDAKRYCEFHGKRLPSEQEWEFAARSGLVAEEYPWGDNWERMRANTWQGQWPSGNNEADGYKGTSPVDAYRPQNTYGFYDMLGNVWEWCQSRYYERLVSREMQVHMHVLKGGSHVDSVDGDVNLPVRNGQRMGQSPDYTAGNVGFRCARSAPEMEPASKTKPKKAEKKKSKLPRIYRKPKAHVQEGHTRQRRDEL